MSTNNDDFLKRLLATFRVEADEHIQAMSVGLVELEKMAPGAQRTEAVENIYREAHSLKGAARAVNLAEMESVCHALESVLAALKHTRIETTPALFDLLQQSLTTLGALLAVSDQNKSEARKLPVAALLRQLEASLQSTSSGEQNTPSLPIETTVNTVLDSVPQTSNPVTGTVRVRTAKLDSLMRQTEELLVPRLAAGERARELRELGSLFATWKKDFAAVRPAMRAIERSVRTTASGAATVQQELGRLLSYLDTQPSLMTTIENRLSTLERSAAHDYRALNSMVDSLLGDVKEMYMLPFSSLLESFPRLVRELARAQDKKVELVIRGDEIEIDRRILEQIKDPLNHLLRNSIDHGVEPPAARALKSKPAHATLTITLAYRDGNKIDILMTDDGAGIDEAKVKSAVGKLGLMSAGELARLSGPEARALVFHSGVSTSPVVTDISGRGLGLAIVRERIERLGGAITMETQPDQGTSFRIVLPLTLATFRAVLVRVSDKMFVVPAVSVERVALVKANDIRTVENRETISLDGQALSLVWLSDLLETARQPVDPDSPAQVVVLSLGANRIALRVDAVLAEQEVLVKGLGPQLKRVRNVAGASILGAGQVVPVLNVPDLIQSAMKSPASPDVKVRDRQNEVVAAQTILVAEDSITSRALLKNILESAGYSVTTAVDGVDAYTALKTGTFDLLVSDVEMPRMNGFDLAAKVRADTQLAQIPIVLVTALASREHRERGIDAGANAYIVKSSFDQGNLLETIRRLI